MAKLWKRMVALGTVLCMCAGSLFGCGSSESVKKIECPAEAPGTADVLGTAKIPTFVQSPFVGGTEGEYNEDREEQWYEEMSARTDARVQIGSKLDAYNKRSMQEYLKDHQGNVAYSPINLWMALAMLGECTDADSSAQILSALDVKDKEELQALVQHVWDATERDDGVSISLLANSLWMDHRYAYLSDGVKTLAEKYHASTFSGTMGSEEYNQLLQKWLDENTKGLLTDIAKEQGFEEDTMLALASAFYFKDKWADTFDESGTSKEIFRGKDGDMEYDFLHGTRTCAYYEGKTFEALLLNFEGNRGMWFVLPKEGVTTDQVLEDEAAMQILTGNLSEEERRTVEATLALPKFDITTRVDLSQGLMNMGITDIFDSSKADFSGILSGYAPGSAVLSDALQATRIKIDEDGCEAAAFTIFKAGATMMPESINFTVDRPFLFSVISDADLPLFTGVVNTL